jgi:hypothetical protein
MISQRLEAGNIGGCAVSFVSQPAIGDQPMPLRLSPYLRPLVALAMVAASSILALAQQTSPSRVRGTIESVDGETLMVKSRSGEDVKLTMAGDIRVVGIVKVHVFPEDMRGTGEGSRPYDLRPNSSMTNATVADSVVGNDGHTLLIKYKDGEKKVMVGPDTPVVTYVPAGKPDLKPGAKVIAFMKKLPDGSFETNRVSVGRDGLTPPM